MSHIKYYPMEDKDITNARLMTYNELSEIENITDILPKHKSYVILL